MMTLQSRKAGQPRMTNIPIIPLVGAFFIGLPFQSNAQDFDNTDLPGRDFSNFNLGRSAWEDCKKACLANKLGTDCTWHRFSARIRRGIPNGLPPTST